MKQAKEGARGNFHGSQASEGAMGGNTPGKEGHRATGKSNHHEATLRSGSMPKAVAVPNKLGLYEPTDPMPSGESDHETLRAGKKPKAERAVSHAKHSPESLKRARMLNVRSEQGGAEKEGGW